MLVAPPVVFLLNVYTETDLQRQRLRPLVLASVHVKKCREPHEQHATIAQWFLAHDAGGYYANRAKRLAQCFLPLLHAQHVAQEAALFTISGRSYAMVTGATNSARLPVRQPGLRLHQAKRGPRSLETITVPSRMRPHSMKKISAQPWCRSVSA